MIGTGTAKVRLEIVKMGPNTKLSIQTATKAKLMMAKLEGNSSSSTAKTSTSSSKISTKTVNRPDGTFWDIQVGAFSSKDNATKRAKSLKNAGFSKIAFQTVTSTGVIRVVIKEVAAQDVPKIEQQLKNNGFYEYTIRERKK